MFWTVPLSIIGSFSLYTQQTVYVIQVCWQLAELSFKENARKMGSFRQNTDTRHTQQTHLLTYLLTYLLIHSTVQSPSWEANRFTASQEIPRISRNPKVHYRTHKRPPPVSILGQPNPVHIPTTTLVASDLEKCMHLISVARNTTLLPVLNSLDHKCCTNRISSWGVYRIPLATLSSLFIHFLHWALRIHKNI